MLNSFTGTGKTIKNTTIFLVYELFLYLINVQCTFKLVDKAWKENMLIWSIIYCVPNTYESVAFAATSVLRIINTNKNRFFQWNKFASNDKTKLVKNHTTISSNPLLYWSPKVLLTYIFLYKFKYLTELQKLSAKKA